MTAFIHHRADGTTTHLQCDDGLHGVHHTYDRKPTALDAATENAIIERAIKAARRSSATRSTSPTRTTMSSKPYKPLDLSHIRTNRSGELFAQIVSMSRNRPPRRRQAAHAFDAEPDHEAALKHLEDARDHIEAVQAGRDYNRDRFTRYLRAALEAMQGGAEDESDDLLTSPDEGGPARVRAKDNMGETPARSVATTVGQRRDIDHRRDFDPTARGADSALTDYDPIKLFQKAD